MIADIDIWRTAWLMIDRYGEGAEFEAASRADKLLEDGDLEGATVWRRVLAAMDEMRRTERKSGQAVN